MQNVEFEASKISDLPSEYDLERLVAFNALNDSEVLLLFAEKNLDYRMNTAAASFAKTKTDNMQNYIAFCTSKGKLVQVLSVANEPFNIHSIQVLPGNKFLLACARSKYRPANNHDKNGRIYDFCGNLLNTILLGDGIQDVQVSDNGNIWTSYFDEGVFGNYGWDEPIGASGLKLWSERGEPHYDYSPPEGLDRICDCYAINVESNRTTWAYYYTDFPLVKIKDRVAADYWHLPITGSDCFAIYRNYALFRGGYENRNSFFLVQLFENHKAKVVKKITLINVGEATGVTCRGESIFLISDLGIFRISLSLLISDHG